MDQVSEEFVSYAIQDRTVPETSKIYCEWADKYDEAMVNVSYNGPKVTAAAFFELRLDKGVRILDVGAGTGKLGQALKDEGYDNLDALDPSDMIKKAQEDNIYRNYIKDFVKLGRILPIPNGTYDVVIMTGVLTPGHIHVEDLLMLVRVVKPGGLICWTCSEPGYYGNENAKYSANNIQSTINKYIEDGVWSYFRPTKVVEDYYKKGPGFFHCMVVH